MDEWKARLLDAIVGALVADGIHLAAKALAARLRKKTPDAGKHFKRS